MFVCHEDILENIFVFIIVDWADSVFALATTMLTQEVICLLKKKIAKQQGENKK